MAYELSISHSRETHSKVVLCQTFTGCSVAPVNTGQLTSNRKQW